MLKRIVIVIFEILFLSSHLISQQEVLDFSLENGLHSKHTLKKLSEISSGIEYIKLETAQNCLIKYISEVIPFNGGYLINDSFDKLFFFDSLGEFRWKIDQQGNGPTEYTRCKAAVNPQTNEIWIANGPKGFLIFNKHGNYLRTSSIKLRIKDFAFTPNGDIIYTSGSPSDTMLLRILRTNGEIVKEFLNYYKKQLFGFDDIGRPIRFSTPSIRKTSDGFLIHKQDSVWKLNSIYQLIPLVRSNHAIKNEKNKFYKHSIFFLNDNWLGFQISWDRIQGILDLNSEYFYKFGDDGNGLIDDLDGGTPCFLTSAIDGILLTIINPAEILSEGYTPRIGSSLQEILIKTSINDNPIIRKIILWNQF